MTRHTRKLRNRLAIVSIGIGVLLFLFLFVYLLVCSQMVKSSSGEGQSYRFDAASTHGSFHIIDVPYLSQSGNYPTGCESVSATMLMQYYGVDITPDQLIDQYLQKEDFTWENGVRIGPDPREAFVGNPYSSNSYGCYAPVIIDALRRACPDTLEVRNETGSSLAHLTELYVDADIPVLVWATMDMKESWKSDSWELKDGSTFTWLAGEHCLVLVGYDEDRYYFNDPYENHGVIGYEKRLVETRYRELGFQSVVVVRVGNGS